MTYRVNLLAAESIPGISLERVVTESKQVWGRKIIDPQSPDEHRYLGAGLFFVYKLDRLATAQANVPEPEQRRLAGRIKASENALEILHSLEDRAVKFPFS